MPTRLPITDLDRARRHVLGQRLYRLRKKYKYLKSLGLKYSAARVKARILEVSREYAGMGGRPR